MSPVGRGRRWRRSGGRKQHRGAGGGEHGLEAAQPATGSASSLADLQAGDHAVVQEIGGEPLFRRRLLEVGLLPGVPIQVARVAPLGDPLEIVVRGAHLSLRRSEAIHVAVNQVPRDFHPGHLESNADSEANAPPLRYRVAVAGNPNTGKTTLFNALTGGNGPVGNYPGITVTRRVGSFSLGHEAEIELVDVPGAYSLYARSHDEQVAIDELLGRAGDPIPDAVMLVIDATTLERGLYLLLQVQELAIPVMVVLNMMDEARREGIVIDMNALSAHLDLPVAGIVARSGEGLPQLRSRLLKLLQDPPPPDETHWHWRPTEDLKNHLDELREAVESMVGADAPMARKRAVALWSLMSIHPGDDLEGIPQRLRRLVVDIREDMLSHGHDLDMEVIKARYDHIDRDKSHYLRRSGYAVRSLTDRIDSVLTHPFLGLLVFMVVMASIFGAIFDLASPMIDILTTLVAVVQSHVASVLPPGLWNDLLVDGVLAGVGAVVVFLPQILLLFFLMTLLEGSGYMARAAFVIDRIMTRIGLHGKAFVPMLSGYACTVPGIMATRTIESRRDRLLTIMVLPLITCSARLPVYTLIIAALFPAKERIFGPVSLGMAMLFGIYVLSTVLTILVGAVLGRTVFKGHPSALLMELPSYRLPSASLVMRVLWDRTRVFLKTAGTVILIASVVLWGLLHFPRDVDFSQDYEAATVAAAHDPVLLEKLKAQRKAEALEQSYAGRMGKTLEPIIRPLGFDWKIGVGLIGSLAAREVFVATMGLIYGVDDQPDSTNDSLQDLMKKETRADGSLLYTPLTGISLLVFFMIALQCVSTIAVVRQETASWKWTAFQFAYITGLAYFAALLVYQGGRLLGFS